MADTQCFGLVQKNEICVSVNRARVFWNSCSGCEARNNGIECLPSECVRSDRTGIPDIRKAEVDTLRQSRDIGTPPCKAHDVVPFANQGLRGRTTDGSGRAREKDAFFSGLCVHLPDPTGRLVTCRMAD